MVKSLSVKTVGLSLAALMAQALPLSAQSLLEAAPVVTRAQPGASDAILSTRAAPVEPEENTLAGLVPFEQSAPSYRLAGEDDIGRFTFNLSAEQVALGGSLSLPYRNAVSVLPDTSVMDVTVNGKPAGTFRIASPNDFKPEQIKVAGALLKPGRNEVTLRARQFHRVDCSLEATYELWSELDPKTSGFIAAKSDGFNFFDDVLTVARNDAGVTDIRLILPQTATAEMLNDAAPVLQTLALLMNRDDLSVSVGDKPGTGPGIDLYVSTEKTRALLGGASAAAAIPYGLSVADAGEPGRATVSLRGATRAEISSQLLAAIRGPLKESLDSGIFANGTGTIRADASGSYQLSDTGYETRVFSGRLSRTDFNMVMPADFYPADYDTIGIRLFAATSPGLKRTAQFLVRVNDKVVTSYPFRNTEGEQFEGKLIELPLRAFHPGENKVELLAEVPMASDDVCAPEARNDAKPRFILLKNTEITVPALARIGRLPDIAAFAGNAYPYADGKPFDVFVERPDGQSVGAALTVLSRLALSARNPLNANIKLSAATPTEGRNALVITTDQEFAELGNAGKGQFPPNGFSEDTSAAAVGPDPFKTAAITDDAMLQAVAVSSGNDDADALLDAFKKSTTQSDAMSWSGRIGNWFSLGGTRFAQWLNYDDGVNKTLALKPDQSLLTLSQIPSPEGSATWTVLHARSPSDVAAGVKRLVDPAVWSRLDGGSAEIETASLSVNTMPAATHFIGGMTDQSPANLRRLAAAWFSDNFQFYVLLIVASMGIFGVWLGRAVPRKGVRSDQ